LKIKTTSKKESGKLKAPKILESSEEKKELKHGKKNGIKILTMILTINPGLKDPDSGVY